MMSLVFVTIWACQTHVPIIGRADRFGFQNFCSPGPRTRGDNLGDNFFEGSRKVLINFDH